MLRASEILEVMSKQENDKVARDEMVGLLLGKPIKYDFSEYIDNQVNGH